MKSPEQINETMKRRIDMVNLTTIPCGFSVPSSWVENWRQELIDQEISEHMVKPLDTGLDLKIKWSDFAPCVRENRQK